MMQAVRLVPNRVNQFLIVGPKPSLTIMITIIYTVIIPPRFAGRYKRSAAIGKFFLQIHQSCVECGQLKHLGLVGSSLCSLAGIIGRFSL